MQLFLDIRRYIGAARAGARFQFDLRGRQMLAAESDYHCKRGALAQPTFDTNVSSVKPCQLAHQREADAGPLVRSGPSSNHPVKALEQVGQLAFVDTDARVR